MELRLHETKLPIKGLCRKYVFYHISDLHIAVCSPERDSDAIAQAETATKRWMRDGIPPVDILNSIIDFVNANDCDGLLVAGDCIDYFSEDIAEYIKDTLAKCRREVFYIPGNHERLRIEQNENDSVFAPRFAPLMRGNQLNWVKDYGDFLLVGIDNSTKEISESQVAFFKEQIKRNMPIVLLVHIPFYTDDIDAPIRKNCGDSEKKIRYFSMGTVGTPDSGMEFAELIKSEQSNVVAVIAGHVHFAYEGSLENGAAQITSAPAFKRFVRKLEICPAE